MINSSSSNRRQTRSYNGRGLHGSTVESLGQRIVGGAIAEGESLNISELQDELDVSLTVVREALRVLAAKGLVAARQKRGTFIRPRAAWNLLDSDVMRWQFASQVRPGFLQDLNELRAIMEPPCARVAAERRTDEDLAMLQMHVDEMSSSTGDSSRVVQSDVGFHRALLHATHNELLAQMGGIIDNALAERDRLVHEEDPVGDPAPLHRKVFDAVRSGDPAGAEIAMRQLVAASVKDVDGLQARRAAVSAGGAAPLRKTNPDSLADAAETARSL